jgi:uncharacterized membrane protein
MTVWTAVLVSSAVAFALKLAGYLVPGRWTRHPRVATVSALLPACLLAALVVVQTFTSGQHLTLDARAVGLAAAAIALVLRAPFLVVVIIAAAATAATRAIGWG